MHCYLLRSNSLKGIVMMTNYKVDKQFCQFMRHENCTNKKYLEFMK